jgi:hypothetical protein
MAIITIENLEKAINVWRSRSPAIGDELALCREVRVLADIYAMMIVRRQSYIDTEKTTPEHQVTSEQLAAYNAIFSQTA